MERNNNPAAFHPEELKNTEIASTSIIDANTNSAPDPSGKYISARALRDGFELSGSAMYIFLALISAGLFFVVTRLEQKEVTALVVVTIWAIGMYLYARHVQKNETKTASGAFAPLEKDYKDASHAEKLGTWYPPTTVYPIGKYSPKGLRFLPKSPELTAIAIDMFFVRMFDKSRYQRFLLVLDKFYKVYSYMLGGRYEVQSYYPVLMDIRKEALRIMYSFAIITPTILKHYEFDPHAVIQRNIERLTTHTRYLIQTVENYAKQGLGIYYLPDSKVLPYEEGQENLLP